MPDVAIITDRALNEALNGAHSITLSSYILGKQTEVLLEAAARRGAEVQVILSGECLGPNAAMLEQRNLDTVACLRASGVDASVVPQEMVHLKVAMIDGVAYCDDRNWTGSGELLVRDQQAEDIARVQAVLAGLKEAQPGGSGVAGDVPDSTSSLALEKRTALALEQQILTSDPAPVIELETETLGPASITKALEILAKRSEVRLLVCKQAYERDQSTQAEVRRLQQAGIEIKLTSSDEKIALADATAWVGSANLSATMPGMLDWGLRISDASEMHQLQNIFEKRWLQAHDV